MRGTTEETTLLGHVTKGLEQTTERGPVGHVLRPAAQQGHLKILGYLYDGRQALVVIADHVQNCLRVVGGEGKVLAEHLVQNGAERVHIG